MENQKYLIMRITLVALLISGIFGSRPVRAETMNSGWAQSIGGADLDYGSAIALDANGNLYSTGFVSNGPSNRDIFINKLDGSGNFIWSKAIGGPSSDSSYGIEVDREGNAYITGSYSDTVDFDPGTSTSPLTSVGSNDIFLSKFDMNGNFIWAKGMGSTSYDSGSNIAVDGSGNIYLTGMYSNTVDVDPGPGISNLTSAGERDVLLSKFDVNGNLIWAKSIGGAADDAAYGLTIDGSGGIYFSGYFTGTVDFDPGTDTRYLTSFSGKDIFISKFDRDGNFVWATPISIGGSDNAIEIAIDGWGNLYTVGYGGAVGSPDVFLGKLDENGNIIWARNFGGDTGYGIAVDTNGYVYFTGDFSGTVDFDLGVGTNYLTSTGAGDIFVNKVDGYGNLVWAKSFGGPSGDLPDGIALDSSGNVYINGSYFDTADFDPGAGTHYLTSAGSGDAFITKLNITPQTHYVKWNATGSNNGTSWADAYTDLQSALAVASIGDEIWVAAGTYKPTPNTDRNVSFIIKNGVAIYGGFVGTETARTQRDPQANLSLLSGDIGLAGNSSDNSYHVLIASNVNNATILDGFTIEAGSANENVPYQTANGGGVLITNNGSPSLSNLTFRENSGGRGAGIFMWGSPTLTNVLFLNNSASLTGGGIYTYHGSSPTLTNVTFDHNSAEQGGGMFTDEASYPTLKNVTFSRNTATQGGGMYSGMGEILLTNATFHANTATVGGGIYNGSYGTLSLTHVTLNGNAASSDGGIHDVSFNSSVTIHNSIIYGNPGGELAGTINASYSIVQGGYAGIGNLNADPLLGPLQDNGSSTQTIALLSSSPAIDTADNTYCPTTDQRGMTRPQGSACDIGAYESVALPTLTATVSPTQTLIPTASNIPTVSATPILNCGAVSHSSLGLSGNIMSLNITNPTGIPLAIQDVFLVWDHDKGHSVGIDKTLILQNASLNGTSFWSGNGIGPSLAITPLDLYLPPGDSAIVFTFHQTYDRPDGSEELIINFRTNGCQAYPIHAEYVPPTHTPTATETPTLTPTYTLTVTPSYSYNPLYLSLTGSQTIGGVSSADEDILRFDGTNWSLFFDGSDVGVGSPDLSAFSIMDADTILMSFSANITVNGITATPQDVLRFDATSLGSTTAGAWSLYFDGSDVGFDDATNEKIDSLKLLPDGRLLISTTGNPSVSGATTARDEDVLVFTPTFLGDVTGGTWSMYFDGSDVGLSETSGEDIDALDVVGNTVYLSAQDVFSVSGIAGEDDDVFVCAATSTGDTTVCNYASSLYFDGSTWGLTSNDIDGFNVLAVGSIPTAVPTNTPRQMPTPTSTRISTATGTSSPSPTQTFTVTSSPTMTISQTPTSGSGNTLTFIPVADARVSQASPSTNYGTATTLQADGGTGTVQTSYLLFNAGGITGPMQSAKLRIFCTTNGTANGPAVYLSNNNWSELGAGGINWNNQPTLLSGAFDNKGSIAANSWVEYDVTSLITTNGTYSFALVADSSDGIVFSSREGTTPPQLVITFGSASATSTPSPTNPPSLTNTPTATHTPTVMAATSTFTASPTQIISSETPTASAIPSQTPITGSSQFTFTPVGDAYVDANNPANNYGALTTLRVDASPVIRSYLRFNIQGLNGLVTRATLRVFANSASSQGCMANIVSDNTWSESTLNYNNAPPLGGALGSSGPIIAGMWISMDVTAYITGNAIYNLALTTPGSTAVSLASRESGANTPQLIIETTP